MLPAALTTKLAWGGVAGPLAFISAWALGAATTSRDYSSVDDTISRLAAIGADSRPVMTTGMIVFGVALPAYAIALRRAVTGRAWVAAAATGISTLAVAALPVDHSAPVDVLHAVAAGIGYLTLAATPALAASALRNRGHDRLAISGLGLASISAAALATSLVTDATGLFQRIGLTASDLWLIASVPAIRSLLR